VPSSLGIDSVDFFRPFLKTVLSVFINLLPDNGMKMESAHEEHGKGCEDRVSHLELPSLREKKGGAD
jgi:hypothetical protein